MYDTMKNVNTYKWFYRISEKLIMLLWHLNYVSIVKLNEYRSLYPQRPWDVRGKFDVHGQKHYLTSDGMTYNLRNPLWGREDLEPQEKPQFVEESL
jgi:hypothetical protein